MTALPRALAVTGAVLALGGTALAANEIAGRDRAPAAAIVTIDSTAPLFSVAGLVSGQTLDRCTVITNEGPQPADVTLFGTASQADLSPWLHLELVRGSMPAGAAPDGSCTGFAADPEDWGNGTPGVIFDGTLDQLPGGDSGVADPTRWAAHESHAYLLRVHYTGDNPQQGLSTTQSFGWGATPFDDRGPDPFQDPGMVPATTAGTSTSAGPVAPSSIAGGTTILATHQCTVVTFPARSYIGARAISRTAKKVAKATTATTRKSLTAAKTTKATRSSLASSASSVVSAGETRRDLTQAQVTYRQKLLTATLTARRSPVLAVRLAPKSDGTLAIRVGLRKNGLITSPHRWRWVRVRVNAGATKTTLAWPFVATAQMNQLKTGYNQVDLSLNRGRAKERLKGLPALFHRSFAFVVGDPATTTTPGGSKTDCTLG